MRWLIALTLILAGCGPAPIHYHNTQNTNFGQAEFDSDHNDCERNSVRPASAVTGAPAGAVTVIDQRLLASCLAGRGWQATPPK